MRATKGVIEEARRLANISKLPTTAVYQGNIAGMNCWNFYEATNPKILRGEYGKPEVTALPDCWHD